MKKISLLFNVVFFYNYIVDILFSMAVIDMTTLHIIYNTQTS